MTSISARIPDDERDELDEVAELLGLDRSETIRKALAEGLRDLRVRLAVERYQTGEVSVNEAARIAGVPLGEWLEIAREFLRSKDNPNKLKVFVNTTPADLERDAETARDL